MTPLERLNGLKVKARRDTGYLMLIIKNKTLTLAPEVKYEK